MEERSNKNIMCSVLFLDIVEYSKKSVAGQISLKDRFNSFLSTAIRDVPLSDRIILDTGDGAAINFLGDIEDALRSALSLRSSMLSESPDIDPPLLVRMGINLGPVRLVRDINGQPNIVGDGINVAQRVMSFADASQILVSRSYFDAVSRLSPQYAGMFHFQGSRTDKHVREHEVYAIGYPGDKTNHSISATARHAAAGPSGWFGKATAPLLSVWRWIGGKLNALVEDVAALYRHIEPKRRPLFLALVGVPLVLLLAFTLKTLSRIEMSARPASVAAPVAAAGAGQVLASAKTAEPADAVRTKKAAEAAKAKHDEAAKNKPHKIEPRKTKTGGDPVQSKIFGFSTGSDQKNSARISLRCARGALLFVDGGQKGRLETSPLVIDVQPGKHVVIVIDPNQKMFSKTIQSQAGKVVELKPPFCR